MPLAAREVVPLGSDWSFHLGDLPAGAESADFDVSAWDKVSLPHNWNRMGGTAKRREDYQNVKGSGWYRRGFPTPDKLGNRRVWVQFDAASVVADVWVNGVHLGRHAGAFAGFRFDATPALRPSGENVLVVRVDNSSPREKGSPTADVIPMNGDWPMYGGLYRPASLIVTAPLRIAMEDFGGPGIYASTTALENGKAGLRVLTRLENGTKKAAAGKLQIRVLDRDGRVAAASFVPYRTAAAGERAGRSEVASELVLASPHLWDGLRDPYLYRVNVRLLDHAGRVVDEVEQPLGIRTMRIDPQSGFWLNGRHIALHGVSRHQDRPGKGWAITPDDIAQDTAMIREIGANTVRLAHYQHANETYRQMDEAGMVVWAEIPLVDRSASWYSETTTEAFAANAEQQLRELIRQEYNHPSIAVWSIANEVNLEAAKGRGASNARPLLERLQAVVHAEDPLRPATLADCCGTIAEENKPGLDSVAGITDVIGYNRYHGWYGNTVDFLGRDLDRLHGRFAHQPISISEYGAGGALTQHTDDPLGGPIAAFGRPHPEEFQSHLLEDSWKQIAARPYVWASWVWNMFDFSNELRLEGDLTDTNDKGLVTFDRKTRKDAFYFYKANWSQEPTLYLAERRHSSRPYPVVEVKAYANTETAQLSLNGRSLGEARCEVGICRWPEVTLDPGENRLEATGMRDGKRISDAITWTFEGRPGLYHIRAGTLEEQRAPDGVLWGSDVFSKGGEAHFRDRPSMSRGGEPGPVRPVLGTRNQAPYGSWREGDFRYAIPVPNGRYTVRMHFFEPDEKAGVGTRQFQVLAEGREAARIDVRREAKAARTALTREIAVNVADGTLDLVFQPINGPAIVSGIEVIPK
ncbi:glycoside hydrolase family 2 TIM barrel-domain containing protein [Novosphingobium sp. PhB165]|uniref:glycoside hydrolase family 2 TIM barrel-domain containing protein n=1 Tax=Novosphingobium sp. PhB165 TaxID=2485105 RepID=UPI001FB37899|nr:glycoside hydrolase family 2 TIM barrel-domain containing protein [Novosphingobium sp. PhB165]